MLIPYHTHYIADVVAELPVNPAKRGWTAWVEFTGRTYVCSASGNWIEQAGPNAEVWGEVPGGARNGVNLIFSLAGAYASTCTRVWLNGVRQSRGEDYSESGSTQITFVEAPQASDTILVDYTQA